MATKNNPGKYDCYESADPDEPMFVLLGRDPTACLLVQLWCALREELAETEPDKLAEAYACAEAMEAWADQLGKRDKIERAKKVFLEKIVPGAAAARLAHDPLLRYKFERAKEALAALLHTGDVVRHRGSGIVGKVTGFAHDGTTDVLVDGTGPYKQSELVRCVPEGS